MCDYVTGDPLAPLSDLTALFLRIFDRSPAFERVLCRWIRLGSDRRVRSARFLRSYQVVSSLREDGSPHIENEILEALSRSRRSVRQVQDDLSGRVHTTRGPAGLKRPQ